MPKQAMPELTWALTVFSDRPISFLMHLNFLGSRDALKSGEC
jgi:hypothetical protein